MAAKRVGAESTGEGQGGACLGDPASFMLDKMCWACSELKKRRRCRRR